MNEIVRLIIEFVLGGGILTLLMFKPNYSKAHSDAEAKMLENYRNLLDVCGVLEKKNSELTVTLNEVNNKIDIMTEGQRKMSERLEFLEGIKCENTKCKKRVPPIKK